MTRETAHEIREIPRRAALTLKNVSRRYAGGSLPTLPRDLGNRFLDIVKLDDYQEPYQALKYAPYYSYSTVVMEMKDMMLNNKGSNINHSGMYTGGTRSPRVVLHIRARLPTCARVHVCTCINIRVQAHVLEIEGIRIRMCTEQQSIRLTAINTLSPCTLFSPPPPPLPPLLYHPQRCTRMVQLTHRTIMRYRNSARCPCSTRTEQDAARPPPPRQAATRTTPSSPRPRRGEIRRRTRRYVVFVSR